MTAPAKEEDEPLAKAAKLKVTAENSGYHSSTSVPTAVPTDAKLEDLGLHSDAGESLSSDSEEKPLVRATASDLFSMMGEPGPEPRFRPRRNICQT